MATTKTGGTTANLGTTAPVVQVQTVAGNTGTQALYKAVQAAVAAHNAANAKAAPHTTTLVSVWPNNAKGMAWQLALMATLARQHGANMVRLGVHGGAVALCGTQAAIKAAQAAHLAAHNAYVTAANGAYNPATHGNRVGFTNAYLCGMPAGLAVALGQKPTLAYAIGYLYGFTPPANGTAYALGAHAGAAMARAAKPAKAATTAPVAVATQPATTATQPATTATQPAKASA